MGDHIIVGVDTGFAHIGWCAVRVRSPLFHEADIIAMGEVRTESSAKKLKIKVGDDDFARSRLVGTALRKVILEYKPKLLTCEAFSQMRNASAAVKVGRCFGILAQLSVEHELAVLHATPMEIKKSVCGSGEASKKEVQEALDATFKGKPLALLAKAKIPPGRHEHPFDSLGSVLACWDHDIMRMLRAK